MTRANQTALLPGFGALHLERIKMSSGVFRLSNLAFLFGLVAGCGSNYSGSGTSNSGGTTVNVAFAPVTPSVAAVQVGSGAYQAEALTSGGLSFSLPSGTTTFAVAYVCNPLPQTVGVQQYATTLETVVEASTADGTSATLWCPYTLQGDTQANPGGQTGALTVNVNATGIPSASSLLVVAINGAQATQQLFASVNASGSFGAPIGTDRVEVFALDSSGDVVAARNVSSQTVPGSLNGGTAILLGAADQTTSQSITYNNVPSQFRSLGVSAWFNLGPSGILIGSFKTQYQYPALPAGATENGDFYTWVASDVLNLSFSESVSVTVNSTSAGPMTFNFPAPWSYSGPTPAVRPTFDFSSYAGFSGKSGNVYGASLFWTDGTNGAIGTSQYSVSVSASANYLNGATSITIPNLSSLHGFLPTPPTGADVTWGAQISQSSSSVLSVTQPNSTSSAAGNQGDYLEP